MIFIKLKFATQKLFFGFEFSKNRIFENLFYINDYIILFALISTLQKYNLTNSYDSHVCLAVYSVVQ